MLPSGPDRAFNMGSISSEELTLISTRSFRSVHFIDGGDTAVIRFIGADGTEIAVMMPRADAENMSKALMRSGSASSWEQRSYHD